MILKLILILQMINNNNIKISTYNNKLIILNQRIALF